MVAQAEFGLDSPKKLYLSSLDLGVSQPKRSGAEKRTG